jgi:hypothetical protein
MMTNDMNPYVRLVGDVVAALRLAACDQRAANVDPPPSLVLLFFRLPLGSRSPLPLSQTAPSP